jgi:ABC-type transport system involved in multi-copper enzyme maturation permease subunit
MSLLAIEWLKLKRYRSFWILAGAFAALLVLWNVGIKTGVISFGPENISLLNNDYSFPSVWRNFGWWCSMFILFLSILIITLTCNEFTFRTHRQNVIDGWSRLQFYHAKVFMVLAFSIGTTVLVFVTGSILGFASGGSVQGLFADLRHLGYMFLLTLNYMGLSMILALLIRRSGLTIALFMIYALFVELAIKGIANFYTHTHVGNFLPLQASDELLPFPLPAAASVVMKTQLNLGGPADWTYVLASCGYIALYYLLGRTIVLKRDM